ncbi:MAG TPA: DegT/DnrJ/EryC1/StrS family aminotransferase [Myxococcota bacterium]|nr:DegT/DnrJ/EryC1/StrS family aminotransferase [Myxococcota bacterium]
MADNGGTDRRTGARRPVPLARPCFSQHELGAVRRVMQSCHVTQGPETAAFEADLSALVGGRETVAVSSGGAALLLAMHAIGIGPGDEVVVPDFVFPAAAMGAMFMGAVPVPADVETETMAMTPETAARCITPRTKAVVAVHPFGIPADIEGIVQACPEGVPVIEDAACALGGLTAGGAAAGTVGRISCFSFHPRKSITTGEGGCLAASGSDADRLRRLRDYGRTGRGFGDVFGEIGMNFRMSDLAAAIGRVQLERVHESISTRQKLFSRYATNLGDIAGLRIPGGYLRPGNTFQSLVARVQVDARALVSELAARGVQSGPSAHSLRGQTAFAARYPGMAGAGDGSGRMLAEHTVVLPLFDRMTFKDVDFVCEAVRDALRHMA